MAEQQQQQAAAAVAVAAATAATATASNAPCASNRPILLLPGETTEQRRARLRARKERDRQQRASRSIAEREADRATQRANQTNQQRAEHATRQASTRAQQPTTYRCAKSFPADGSMQRHDLGRMEHECPHCKALHWAHERTKGGVNAGTASYGMCCMHGTVQLPAFRPH